MKKLLEKIKTFFAFVIYKIARKDNTEIKSLNRQVPYMNKPISESAEDEIGMKVYVGENQLLLSGKAWEINSLLKQYSRKYKYVKDWVDHHSTTHLAQNQ